MSPKMRVALSAIEQRLDLRRKVLEALEIRALVWREGALYLSDGQNDLRSLARLYEGRVLAADKLTPLNGR